MIHGFCCFYIFYTFFFSHQSCLCLDFTPTPTQQLKKILFESPLTYIIIKEIIMFMFFVILIINTLSQVYFKYVLKIVYYAVAFMEVGLK